MVLAGADEDPWWWCEEGGLHMPRRKERRVLLDVSPAWKVAPLKAAGVECLVHGNLELERG